MATRNPALDGVFGFDQVRDGRIVRNCLRNWDQGFSKERCNDMLVVDFPRGIASEQENADSRGMMRESQADDPVVTASFRLQDCDRSTKTYSDADAMYFMLED